MITNEEYQRRKWHNMAELMQICQKLRRDQSTSYEISTHDDLSSEIGQTLSVFAEVVSKEKAILTGLRDHDQILRLIDDIAVLYKRLEFYSHILNENNKKISQFSIHLAELLHDQRERDIKI
jgi:hypothetical protein